MPTHGSSYCYGVDFKGKLSGKFFCGFRHLSGPIAACSPSSEATVPVRRPQKVPSHLFSHARSLKARRSMVTDQASVLASEGEGRTFDRAGCANPPKVGKEPALTVSRDFSGGTSPTLRADTRPARVCRAIARKRRAHPRGRQCLSRRR